MLCKKRKRKKKQCPPQANFKKSKELTLHILGSIFVPVDCCIYWGEISSTLKVQDQLCYIGVSLLSHRFYPPATFPKWLNLLMATKHPGKCQAIHILNSCLLLLLPPMWTPTNMSAEISVWAYQPRDGWYENATWSPETTKSKWWVCSSPCIVWFPVPTNINLHSRQSVGCSDAF